jgi:hypothetical protein
LIEIRNKANRELSASDAKYNMVKQTYLKQKREADSKLISLIMSKNMVLIQCGIEYKSLIEKVCGDKNLPEELNAAEKKLDQWTT